MHEQDDDETKEQEARLIDHGIPVVTAIERQSARCTIYFHQRNHAEEEVYHPHTLIPFEEAAPEEGIHELSHIVVSYRLRTHSLNCSPRSSIFLKRSKLAQQGLSSTVLPGLAIL